MKDFTDWYIEWRFIPGYEGRYQVSNDGQVRRLPHKVRMMTKYGYETDYRLKARTLYVKDDCRAGYMVVSFQGFVFFAHRLVAKAFIPNPENKPFINHIDNNPKNNRVDNLEWCTQAENCQHAAKQGRLSFSNSKLTVEQVHAIRASDLSIPAKELGKMFNVGHGVIYKIRNGKSWVVH